jgi:hypothetical protein
MCLSARAWLRRMLDSGLLTSTGVLGSSRLCPNAVESGWALRDEGVFWRDVLRLCCW